ncbi:MAG: DegT/DnrJ/EryC1/StrS family aminotransferase [Candidatus Aenigmatarchaeota archaeon]
MIPLGKVEIDENEIDAVKDVLNSGWLAHGPKTKEFEKMFAEYIGTKHAISVNSCASALHLAIECLGIKGDIILPSFTFVASANTIVTAGSNPVFVDIEKDTCNINPHEIEKKITDKTKAIMPVHFAGHPCDMKHITEIAEKNNLVVIEDSAECIGGEFNGKRTGSSGIGCFSFYPTKNITTGEGGMITTNDDDFAQKLKTLKAHGISSTAYEREREERPWLRAAVEAGYNFRMCDINAVIGIEQMKKIDEFNKKRIESSNYLTSKLDENKLEVPTIREGCKHVFQMYTIKLNPSINRSHFVKHLREEGIQASVHFDPPVHLQPYYANRGWKKGDFPVTEDVAEHIVTLPMFPSIKREDLDRIAQVINSF